MTDSKGPRQRWYDQHDRLSKSVTLLETFPAEIRTLIADGIIRLAEQECHAQALMANLRSLGPEKVLGIFKSKNKRRAYDENQSVHQALNYLYILSDQERLMIADRVITLIAGIYDYLKLCRDSRREVAQADVSEIIRIYVEEGDVQGQRYVSRLRQKSNGEESTMPVALPSRERVLAEEGDLKIRGDNDQNT